MHGIRVGLKAQQSSLCAGKIGGRLHLPLHLRLVILEKRDTEAHFAQVTENYLRYVAAGKIPEWETAGMLAKYFTTTEAYRLAMRKD